MDPWNDNNLEGLQYRHVTQAVMPTAGRAASTGRSFQCPSLLGVAVVESRCGCRNKKSDEFLEIAASTRGYAYLPRICDSNTPPAVLDFRCSVSMTSMNKKGKKMRKTWSKSWGSRDASALDEMLTWVRSPDDSIAGLPLAGGAMGPKSLKISGWM